MVNTNTGGFNFTHNLSGFGSVPWQVPGLQTGPGVLTNARQFFRIREN